MRPTLVMWSAASLDLILVVMTESFTKSFGFERSTSASCAKATGPANTPANNRPVITPFTTMTSSPFCRDYAGYLFAGLESALQSDCADSSLGGLHGRRRSRLAC